MKNLNKLFINGQWITSKSNETLDIVNPATEQVIASVASANVADVEQAIGAAKKAFIIWSQTSAAEFNYHAPFGGYKMSGNDRKFNNLDVEGFLETKAMITC